MISLWVDCGYVFVDRNWPVS